MNILVSNLAGTASGLQVKTLFSEFGLVQSATIIRRDVSQKLNNYCWVVMQNSNDAEQAIQELDDTSFLHQNINVERAIFALHSI